LARFDIACAVMSMSSFRTAPRIGHLERLKRIYGYVKRFEEGYIRVRTEIPDMSSTKDKEYDWLYEVYGDVKQEIEKDIPIALGKSVITVSYKDANLYHDWTTGRASMGILHFVNGTPIDWYSKKQATVETATYGSEFVAAPVATDQIIDLRITLRQLGVKVLGNSYLFGDNESVVTSGTIPHSGLQKRWLALSYHRVREAIAAGILIFSHMAGKNNPADMLSKHCGYTETWPTLRPTLFWRGKTTECLSKEEKKKLDGIKVVSIDRIEIKC
jgi:hypothetical protein